MPSTIEKSAPVAARVKIARLTSLPSIHPSKLRDGRPVTAWWWPGSMKSGPALNDCTIRPLAVKAASKANVTVVFPTLLPVPAMMIRGAFTTIPQSVSLIPPKIDRIGVPYPMISSYCASPRFSTRPNTCTVLLMS